ncbi:MULTISPECIES: GlxA family transcriptional regulator [Halomonas]|uniref:GlxA family transcriptional regulator n=1 Tax=Halomonas TaxID=2745 RepID=UPI001C93B56B|nr:MULTISPECIES: GlxA family transcriptional regulator [Halomonas]MBY6207063.1 GlxA family transcriptional regulator [Halomonas sp. DP3Y7-2]MBY6229657.1 GlxA family transcriptional regulator [Halomonas sp. DP3Y7-1]MCA0918011.1 GlxA family transcriptional regulator [Halomonas denitrificans]
MRLTYQGPSPEAIGFLLLPRFSMVALFSAIDPLRIANRLSGETLFRWHLISRDGLPVHASNGIPLAVEHALEDTPWLPSLAVCASFEPMAAVDDSLITWLRQRREQRTCLGALDTGAFCLASAGLIDDTVTLHWESLPDFRRQHPHIEAVESLYEVTPSGFFGAGASASIDLALDTIRRRHGDALTRRVKEQLVHDHRRLPASRQRDVRYQERLPQRLATLIGIMDAHLESPLSIPQLASAIGLSERQLERECQQHLSRTPGQLYLERRLSLAHQLVTSTRHSVMDIALASGFASASSFTRAFRQHHGASPSALRRQPTPPMSDSAR